MKTMSLPGYHRNGFVASDALGHMMCGYFEWMICQKAIVAITGRAHCFHDNTYIMFILFL